MCTVSSISSLDPPSKLSSGFLETNIQELNFNMEELALSRRTIIFHLFSKSYHSLFTNKLSFLWSIFLTNCPSLYLVENSLNQVIKILVTTRGFLPSMDHGFLT
jgi:hypothetical protein